MQRFVCDNFSEAALKIQFHGKGAIKIETRARVHYFVVVVNQRDNRSGDESLSMNFSNHIFENITDMLFSVCSGS